MNYIHRSIRGETILNLYAVKQRNANMTTNIPDAGRLIGINAKVDTFQQRRSYILMFRLYLSATIRGD
jgi:hypothetical protein